VPGPSSWDLLPESVINSSFEALLLLNSIGWSLVAGLLAYVLKGDR
jgi:hypothetical protein